MQKIKKEYKVQKLSTKDFTEYARIDIGAFPSAYPRTKEGIAEAVNFFKKVTKDDSINAYGIKEKNALAAGMTLLDFDMNIFGKKVLTGGLAAVAVDALSKKRGMAAAMIKWYVRHYKERGAKLCALYPFRADFYYNMGFGYGVDTSLYRFAPASLYPGECGKVWEVDKENKEQMQLIKDCYECYVESRHGEISRKENFWTSILEKPDNRIIAVNNAEDKTEGYFVFRGYCLSDWAIIGHEMFISEWVCNTPYANACLRECVRRQSDQYNSVIMPNAGAGFRYNLQSPKSLTPTDKCAPDDLCYMQHISIFYRVLDVAGIWKEIARRSFGNGDCTIHFVVEDSFLPELAGEALVSFSNGSAKLMGKIDSEKTAVVQVNININDYSSLLVGSCTFDDLYNAGRATLSDDSKVSVITEIFAISCTPSTILRF